MAVSFNWVSISGSILAELSITRISRVGISFLRNSPRGENTVKRTVIMMNSRIKYAGHQRKWVLRAIKNKNILTINPKIMNPTL
jgi:hypothetical protein